MLFLRNTLFLRFVRLLRKEFLRVRLPLPFAAGEVCLSLLAEAGSGSPAPIPPARALGRDVDP